MGNQCTSGNGSQSRLDKRSDFYEPPDKPALPTKVTRECSANHGAGPDSPPTYNGSVSPIVLESGSHMLQAGFAGKDAPAFICPNNIQNEDFKIGLDLIKMKKDNYIGSTAQEWRGILTYPMERGIVKNWDEMEKVWEHTFKDLGVNARDHNVLLSEALMSPKDKLPWREKVAEMLFETFNAPALYLSLQPVLAMYANGRTSGLMVDCGDGITQIVPIYEGYMLPQATQRINLAGSDITAQMQSLMADRGDYLTSSIHMEIVRDMKEKTSYVALDFEKEMQKYMPLETRYELPDGKSIVIGTERFKCSEPLFQPSLVGVKSMGIHEATHDSIKRCEELNIRKLMYGNIVLVGGTTLCQGFAERMDKEMSCMAPASWEVKVSAPPERNYSTWIGGSILASLSIMQQMWISRQEYEEYGSLIVHRKCTYPNIS